MSPERENFAWKIGFDRRRGVVAMQGAFPHVEFSLDISSMYHRGIRDFNLSGHGDEDATFDGLTSNSVVQLATY